MLFSIKVPVKRKGMSVGELWDAQEREAEAAMGAQGGRQGCGAIEGL